MKIFRISKLVCFVVGAALILDFKDFFISRLRWFIGGLMILYGALGILNSALEKKKPIYKEHGFLFFSLEILMGATILIFVEEFAIVCVIWAVWSIFRETVELREIIDGELHPALAVVSGIESLAVIVLSVMLIAELGEHHAILHTYLLCVELILSSATPIINDLLFRKRGKRVREKSEAEMIETDAPTPPEQAEEAVEEAPSEVEIAAKE